jgi:hypothetical protein
MFQALLAHLQAQIHKWHLVYCVCYVSWLHQVQNGICCASSHLMFVYLSVQYSNPDMNILCRYYFGTTDCSFVDVFPL